MALHLSEAEYARILGGTDASPAPTREDVAAAVQARQPLEGMVLDGLDLSGMNLRRGDFAGASMVGANLTGCDLSYANLHNVKAGGICLRESVLRYVELGGADLSGANLTGAHLTAIDGRGMNLAGADFTGAELRNVRFARSNLRGADLAGARMKLCGFYGSDLSGARLDWACFDVVSELIRSTFGAQALEEHFAAKSAHGGAPSPWWEWVTDEVADALADWRQPGDNWPETELQARGSIPVLDTGPDAVARVLAEHSGKQAKRRAAGPLAGCGGVLLFFLLLTLSAALPFVIVWITMLH